MSSSFVRRPKPSAEALLAYAGLGGGVGVGGGGAPHPALAATAGARAGGGVLPTATAPTAPTRVAGTRPGLQGQTLVSTGHLDVDRLLGGGLPLGAVLLVVEGDPSSRAHLPLLRAFLAEGVACGHDARWVVARAPAGGAAAFLPARVPAEGSEGEKKTTTTSSGDGGGGSSNTTARAGTANGGGGGDNSNDNNNNEDDNDGLQIAWQYRKYIQKPAGAEAPGTGAGARSGSSGSSAFVRRSAASPSPSGGSGGGGTAPSAAVKAGIGRAWCHAHDLSRAMGREALEAAAKLSSFETVECAGGRARDANSCSSSSSSSSSPVGAACAAAVAFFEGEGHGGGGGGGGGGAPAPSVAAGPIALAPPPITRVRRLLVQSLGSLDWLPASSSSNNSNSSNSSNTNPALLLERQVVRAVLRLRQAAQRPSPASCGCCAVVSVDPLLLSASALARLVHACDAAVRVHPLPDDAPAAALLPDAPSVVALLQLVKAPSAALQRQPAVDDRLFVLRSRRKTVHVTPVEVDPDADAVAGGGGGGGVGGLGCAKSLSSKGLDF